MSPANRGKEKEIGIRNLRQRYRFCSELDKHISY